MSRPLPPYASSQPAPRKPAAASFETSARSISSARSHSRACGATSRSANSRAALRTSSCSAVSAKSIPRYSHPHMPDLSGKVAIVTGAGRGIGRDHALALARAGAKVVVNDLGAALSGEGHDDTPAQQVVQEIEALGGEAVANDANVADFEQAGAMVQQALDRFDRLDILVNNAGILRDRMLVNMSEQEWDAVINVHLKGHFAPTRHAAAHWRELSKSGEQLRARVINTS